MFDGFLSFLLLHFVQYTFVFYLFNDYLFVMLVSCHVAIADFINKKKNDKYMCFQEERNNCSYFAS